MLLPTDQQALRKRSSGMYHHRPLHVQATHAADIAIQLALALGSADMLWHEAFPRFVKAGQAGAFMDALVPCILSGSLSSLAPEVVQVSPRPPAPLPSFQALQNKSFGLCPDPHSDLVHFWLVHWGRHAAVV